MRIPRIHQDIPLTPGAEVTLDEAASRHLLRVLRLRPGAALTLFDGRGREHRATLLAGGRQAAVAIGEALERDVESPLEIILAQGISRGERMDYTLQKAVELGVSRILPLFTERCNVKLSGERLARRLAHWQGVIAHACGQCGRNRLPGLAAPRPLDARLCEIPAALRLVLDAGAAAGLAALPRPDGPVLLIAGPEGGLSPAEQDLLYAGGCRPLRLGPRILRTETAALAALAALQALWGDFA